MLVLYSSTRFPFLSYDLSSFPALPPDSKLHNLLSLVAKNVEIATAPETTRSSLLVQHQKLIMEHFGHKKTAVLPEDVIQRLLIGISRFWLPFSPPPLKFTPSMLTPNVTQPMIFCTFSRPVC